MAGVVRTNGVSGLAVGTRSDVRREQLGFSDSGYRLGFFSPTDVIIQRSPFRRSPIHAFVVPHRVLRPDLNILRLISGDPTISIQIADNILGALFRRLELLGSLTENNCTIFILSVSSGLKVIFTRPEEALANSASIWSDFLPCDSTPGHTAFSSSQLLC